MTPNELLKLDKEYLAGLSTDRKALEKYRDDNCIVAYKKSHLGTTFILKGKIEIFGFVCLSPHIRWGNRELLRKSLKTIQRILLDESEEKLIVVDEEQFKIFERRVLLEGLQDE